MPDTTNNPEDMNGFSGDIHPGEGTRKTSNEELVNNEGLTPQEALRQRVIEVFGNDPRVKFAIAMGSSAEGKENNLSDIDICLVMQDDGELNDILRELPQIFPKLGNLVGSYSYNPYHFYVVYEPTVPLDIYFISSSLYFTMKSDKNKIIVDHSNRDTNVQPKQLQPISTEGDNRSEKESNEIIADLFLKGWIRTFRLLSKIEKEDYPTLAYILNRIREDQIVPLLTSIKHYNIPHSKAIKLEEFDADIRELFLDTYCRPERESCIKAVASAAKILKILFDQSHEDFSLNEMRPFANNTYDEITKYAKEHRTTS